MATTLEENSTSVLKNSMGKKSEKSTTVLKNSVDKKNNSSFAHEDAANRSPGRAVPSNRVYDNDLIYIRVPRLFTPVEKHLIDLEKPPQFSPEPQINWTSVLVTPIISVALMLVLVFAMGMSPVMLVMSGVMSVVSAIVAVTNYKKQKKQHGKTDALIHEKYREYLSKVSSELDEAHKKQRKQLISDNPSPKECLQIAKEKELRLWNRRPMDKDFLCVRLGLGEIKAAVAAEFKQAEVVIEENELEKEAKDIADGSKVIADIPICCDIAGGKQIGIIGDRADEIRLVRNLLTELAATHFYDDLKIVALIPSKEVSEWEWLRWLPHCADDQRYGRYIFSSVKENSASLESIEKILKGRKDENGELNKDSSEDMFPHYLFVIAADSLFNEIKSKGSYGIWGCLTSDKEIGCSALFVRDCLEKLPKECKQIIDVKHGKGKIYSTLNSDKKVEFQMDEFSLSEADTFARTLTPLITEEESASYALPGSVSFLEGYGISRPEQLDIGERWKKAKVYETMSVPVAVMANEKLFEFDIHSMKHGSHGIVAGMTRSGKTEMVLSWLLSMAVNFSPQDVSFVLIDWKGTSLISPFRKLPHLAGAISNLDVKKGNVDRNLASVISEVERREKIIDEYSNRGVKNINDMNRLFAQGIISERLSNLLIVIDEFAEFKKAYPDFGKEIDSLMMTGSALGISVILMAQKPGGVVSSVSEANANFRWCLRVASRADSSEMLGKPDAAKIHYDWRGRAYIKVGENDIYEEVQSFWSGAPYEPSCDMNSTLFTPISRVMLNGNRNSCEKVEGKKSESYENEIDAVVRYISDYCKAHGIKSAEQVWTERLPERIALPELLSASFNGTCWPETNASAPAFGLIDEPQNQCQYPLALNFSKCGHTVVYGAPVTGKTTLLQTLVMSIASVRKPDEASVYILDFGGWNMGVLRDLPHVGGIVNENEPERLKKLVLLIEDILQARKEKFSKAGVGNVSSYRDLSSEAIPDIFVIVDNFGYMIKTYPDLDSFFITLTSTGANYGIYLVATATTTNAIPMKISQNIKNALALQLIDKSDYTFTVGKVSSLPPAIMGRGYAKGTPPLEFQTALPAPGADDKTVSDNIRKAAKRMREIWAGDMPAMIPEMPEFISYGSVKAEGIVMGLSVDKVQPVIYDYTKQHYLLISGTEQSGKSNMLRVLARQLKEKLKGKLYVFDIKGGSLAGIKEIADTYLCEAGQIDAFIESIRPELQRRQWEKQNDPDSMFDALIVAVDDYCDFFRAVSEDSISRLHAMVKLGSGLGIYLIIAGDAFMLSSFYNKGQPLSLALSKAKQAVMLGGCMNEHGAIQTKASSVLKGTAVKEGEGIFACSGEYIVFKSMSSSEEGSL